MEPIDFVLGLPTGFRILAILLFAAAAHLVVRLVRRAGEWVLTPTTSPRVAQELFARRHPKVATITSLVVSAVTFALYFIAIGLVLGEFGVSLTAYLATASIAGLAIGFGLQGLVQDMVTGLTLIFSDAMDIGDFIEIGGQIGRVEKIGLRFTTLTNFVGVTVNIPNRNIAQVGRFRRGMVRAYVDIQIPESATDSQVTEIAERIAHGMRSQFPAVLVTDPETFGVFEAHRGGWRYLRVKFRCWPGQAGLIESIFRQRILAAMRDVDANYADWMVSVSYRVPAVRPASARAVARR